MIIFYEFKDAPKSQVEKFRPIFEIYKKISSCSIERNSLKVGEIRDVLFSVAMLNKLQDNNGIRRIPHVYRIFNIIF